MRETKRLPRQRLTFESLVQLVEFRSGSPLKNDLRSAELHAVNPFGALPKAVSSNCNRLKPKCPTRFRSVNTSLNFYGVLTMCTLHLYVGEKAPHVGR